MQASEKVRETGVAVSVNDIEYVVSMIYIAYSLSAL